MSLVIIDYGMGNVRSVQKAFEHLGQEAEISDSISTILKAKALILPGVGAFANAMETLSDKKLITPIQNQIQSGVPFLGICLGLQLLFESSTENGQFEGLGVVSGAVRKFDFTNHPEYGKLKIPHMGWNELQLKNRATLFQNLPDHLMTYFVHSYYVDPSHLAVVSSETRYGYNFVSSIERDNLFATQFHPEKSGEVGLRILSNFVKLTSV